MGQDCPMGEELDMKDIDIKLTDMEARQLETVLKIAQEQLLSTINGSITPQDKLALMQFITSTRLQIRDRLFGG